jgi:ribose-phosphate pyrophosphokinase
MEKHALLFTGRNTSVLAEKIAYHFGQNLGKTQNLGKIIFSNFSDGEFQVNYDASVRGKNVFIIQSTPPPFDNLFELLLMIDAAKRASAKQIIAVIPYYGYARQDRKDKPREAIGAKLVADMLTVAGANRIITMDLHADQIQGFFNIPLDHLYASKIFRDYIKDLQLPNLTIAAPDMGGSKRANAYAKKLNAEIVICYKQRSRANVVDQMTAIGEIEGRNIILIDDLVDTGGTLTKAADMMMERGASSVRAICTHPVLSGNAYENIEKSKIQELIVTDTLPLKQSSPKIKALSVAPFFAQVIEDVLSHQSINTHNIV